MPLAGLTDEESKTVADLRQSVATGLSNDVYLGDDLALVFRALDGAMADAKEAEAARNACRSSYLAVVEGDELAGVIARLQAMQEQSSEQWSVLMVNMARDAAKAEKERDEALGEWAREKADHQATGLTLARLRGERMEEREQARRDLLSLEDKVAEAVVAAHDCGVCSQKCPGCQAVRNLRGAIRFCGWCRSTPGKPCEVHKR